MYIANERNTCIVFPFFLNMEWTLGEWRQGKCLFLIDWQKMRQIINGWTSKTITVCTAQLDILILPVYVFERSIALHQFVLSRNYYVKWVLDRMVQNCFFSPKSNHSQTTSDAYVDYHSNIRLIDFDVVHIPKVGFFQLTCWFQGKFTNFTQNRIIKMLLDVIFLYSDPKYE